MMLTVDRTLKGFYGLRRVSKGCEVAIDSSPQDELWGRIVFSGTIGHFARGVGGTLAECFLFQDDGGESEVCILLDSSRRRTV